MNGPLASAILDYIRDHLRLHLEFLRWSDDLGNLFWVCDARDNDGQRWVSKHPDFYLSAHGLAELMGLELEDGQRESQTAGSSPRISLYRFT